MSSRRRLRAGVTAVLVVTSGVLQAYLPGRSFKVAVLMIALALTVTLWMLLRDATPPAEPERPKLPSAPRAVPPAPAYFVGASHQRAVIALRSFLATPGLAVVRGEPGSGKTTCLRVVVNHPETLRAFGDRRVWVDLDRVGPDAAERRVVEALGYATWAEASAAMLAVGGTLLVLDNSESCWQFAPDQIDPLLAGLANLVERGAKLRVIVAYRGHVEPPGGVPWKPVVEPGLLTAAEAAQLFGSFAAVHAEHPRTAGLLADWGDLPLSVALLARAAAKVDSAGFERLAERWSSRAPAQGTDRRTASLGASLDLSIDPLDDDTRRLLGIFAALPVGLDGADVGAVLAEIPFAELRTADLLDRGLLSEGGAGVRCLPPVAEHVAATFPSVATDLDATRRAFVAVATTRVTERGTEAVRWLAANEPTLVEALAVADSTARIQLGLALVTVDARGRHQALVERQGRGSSAGAARWRTRSSPTRRFANSTRRPSTVSPNGPTSCGRRTPTRRRSAATCW